MVYIVNCQLYRWPEGSHSILPFCFRVILQLPSGTVLRAITVPDSYFRRGRVALTSTAGPPYNPVARAGGLSGLNLSHMPTARATRSAVLTQSGRVQVWRGKGRHEHLIIIFIILILLWGPSTGEQGLSDLVVRPDVSDSATPAKHAQNGRTAGLTIPLGGRWPCWSSLGRPFLSGNLRIRNIPIECTMDT